MPRVVLDPLCPPDLPSSAIQGEVWALNLQVSQHVRNFLSQVMSSNDVLMLRDNNARCPSIDERVNRTNSFTITNDTIYLAIGLNRFTDPQARGFEVFHFPSSSTGRNLANEIINSTTAWRTQFSPIVPNRGVKGDEQGILPTLARTTPPAIAIFPVFHTNPNEREFIRNRENQRRLGFFIAVGIADFFGIQRPSLEGQPTPTPTPQPQPEPTPMPTPTPTPQPQPTQQGLGRFALPLIIGGVAAAVIVPQLVGRQNET